jgi:hypothetical protein
VAVDREVEPRLGPVVCLTIQNIGDHPLHLFSIFWEKGFFLRHVPNGSDTGAEINIVEPGQSLRRHYRPVKGAAYFYKRHITDILTIHANDEAAPRQHRRVELVIGPSAGFLPSDTRVVLHNEESQAA